MKSFGVGVKQITFLGFIMEIKNMVEKKLISHLVVESFKRRFSLALGKKTIKVCYFPIMLIYLSESQDLIVSIWVTKRWFDYLLFSIAYSMKFTVY